MTRRIFSLVVLAVALGAFPSISHADTICDPDGDRLCNASTCTTSSGDKGRCVQRAGGCDCESATSIKCEGCKLKASAKKASCLLKARAKAVGKGGPELVDVSKCIEKFNKAFAKCELKGGVDCPTAGDVDAIEETVDQCVEDVAFGVAGKKLPECGTAAAPQCDGVCPKHKFCEQVGPTKCRCVLGDSIGMDCGFKGVPECWGFCPPEAPLCVDDGVGTCVCASPSGAFLETSSGILD